jgi:hypothetical protein
MPVVECRLLYFHESVVRYQTSMMTEILTWKERVTRETLWVTALGKDSYHHMMHGIA